MYTTGLKRDTTDKFYTKPEIVNMCMDEFERVTLQRPTTIIEPSAGNGSFIPRLKKLNPSRLLLCMDIEPDGFNEIITRSDFLKYEYTSHGNDDEKVFVIGNPPFGRQSSTAIKFIQRTCEFCDVFAFILPRSFKKESMKRHIDRNFHLVSEIDLPENAFTLGTTTKEYNVPCVFQIWKRMDSSRQIEEKMKPIDGRYTFVKKTEDPDISIRRVGVNAGRIEGKETIREKSEQSHYFIKFLTTTPVKIENIAFENADNTVGPKSISKQDVIRALNTQMFG